MKYVCQIQLEKPKNVPFLKANRMLEGCEVCPSRPTEKAHKYRAIVMFRKRPYLRTELTASLPKIQNKPK